jgi:UDPglucose 6-dehydrogenase
MQKVIGIWGSGFVGSATGYIFETLCPDQVEVIYYDKFKPGFQDRKKELLERAEFIFLCLPTPMKVTGEIGLEYIEESLKEIEKGLAEEELLPVLIIRSTSVSGSTDRFATEYPQFPFAFMPEFLTEKNYLQDALNTNRIVIGANNTAIYDNLYSLFYLAYRDKVSYIRLSRKEAETLKYFSNVQLMVQVAISNELYFICDKIDVDYDKVRRILALDERIGKFTQVPGHDGDFGAGGKCLVKDTNAFAYMARQVGYFPTIMDTVIKFNEHIRRVKDWLDIPGAVESNTKFEGKKNA